MRARLHPLPRRSDPAPSPVDHLGTICPSGFLPLAAGNVRTDDLVRIYREHPLFRALRDPDGLGSRCGRCDFRSRCGCAYVPVQAAA